MLLSGGVFVVWIDAPYKDIAIQREKANVIRGYIVDADNANEQLQKIGAEYAAFPADGDRRLQVLLPKQVDSVRLIIDVNEVALRHGMSVNGPVSGKAPHDETKPEQYVAYSLSFRTTATYKVFRDFLTDLERSLALRDISSVGFSSSALDSAVPQSPELAVFNYNVNIVSYGLH